MKRIPVFTISQFLEEVFMALGEIRCPGHMQLLVFQLSWKLWSLKKEKLAQNQLVKPSRHHI